VRARLAHQRGSALITAVLLVGIMMILGLATASYVDGQQRDSGSERMRESAFNVAESALGAQVFQLTHTTWPSAAPAALAPWCDPSSPSSAVPPLTTEQLKRCPDPISLAKSHDTADYGTAACPAGAAGPLWTTVVHDDWDSAAGPTGEQKFYSATNSAGPQPTWDKNGNGRMWVKSTGRARCKVRTLVTAVQQGTRDLTFPHNALTANWVATSSSGRKVIIDTQGTKSGQTFPVVVRCRVPAPSPCAKYQAGQIAPSPPTVDADAGFPNASPLGDLQAFKAYAQQQNTYFGPQSPAGTCPPSLSGTAVYVEDLTPCSYPQDANSASAPGHLYVANGTLSLGGNSRFYGLIYMGNGQGSSGAVVTVSGNAQIVGAVAIDGPGGLQVGSSKKNFVYDGSVFEGFKGVATVTPAPNSWRELAPELAPGS